MKKRELIVDGKKLKLKVADNFFTRMAGLAFKKRFASFRKIDGF